MRIIHDVKYELRIAKLVLQLFGRTKLFLFLLAVPVAFSHGKNRSAYRALGACTTDVFGARVVIVHPDVRFIDEIVLKRCYNPTEDFEIVDGMNVLDAGANVGMFTIYAALRTPHGKVIAIEPESESFRFLKENLRASNISNVVAINAALAGHSGVVSLTGSNPGTMTIMNSVHEAQLHVNAITMQDVFELTGITKFDFAKVDIEGAEFLLTGEPRWLRRVSRLSMEIHPTLGSLSSFVHALEAENYEIQLTRSYDQDTLYLYAKRKR